jgi:hypothetical protein
LLYVTPDRPTFYKDAVEVFWNQSGRGRDEVGKDAVGILMKANGGQRYEPGQWPTTEPENDPNKAIFTSDVTVGGYPLARHEDDGHTHPPEQKCLSCRD